MAAETKSINKIIDQRSRQWTGSGDQQLRIIDLTNIQAIASQTQSDILEIEITCLTRNIVPDRYLRNIGTIGIQGQLKLLHSRAAVCGAGGLGGTIIELLARQGIGHLTIIDNSTYAETDLNRQIMATEKDLGKSKVLVAAKRVNEINGAVKVTPVSKTIDSKTAVQLIQNADIVMDALDNVEARRSVVKACNEINVPFIYGAIAGFSGQLMAVFPGDKGVNSIYDTKDSKVRTGVETFMGTPTVPPAIIAAWEVQEAIKILTGINDPIRNRLIVFDFLENHIHEMSIYS